MTSIIETEGTREWLSALKEHYHLPDTILNDSEEAFTVICMKYKTNVMAGRYCKESKVGLVFKLKELK